MLLNYECIVTISYLLINSNKGDKRKVMDTFFIQEYVAVCMVIMYQVLVMKCIQCTPLCDDH